MNIHRGYFTSLLLLGVVGCSSLLGSKDNSPVPVDVPVFKAVTQLQVSSLLSVDKAEGETFSPVWFNSEVFAVGKDGEVSITRLEDKSKSKSLVFDKELSAGLDANSEMVVAASRKGQVIALGLDGKVRWTQEVRSEVITRPRIVGGRVLVRAQDGRLIALSAINGEVQWQSEVRNPSLSLHVPSGLTPTETGVYAAFPGGKLRFYDLATGGLLWESWVAQPKGASELERVTDVVGDPWLDTNQVCAVSYQGKVACFERNKGEQLWAREFSSVTGLDGDHRFVYATDASSVVYAFDKLTGRQIWKQDKLYARALTRPTVFGKYIAVADFEGKLFLLDSETGEFAAMADVGHAVRAPLVLANERLLVQSTNGDVSLVWLQ